MTECCCLQICGLPSAAYVTLGIPMHDERKRVAIMMMHGWVGRGHQQEIFRNAADNPNPCVRGGLTTRVACRYCKRARSTSAAAETQIVGSDLRPFEHRYFSGGLGYVPFSWRGAVTGRCSPR